MIYPKKDLRQYLIQQAKEVINDYHESEEGDHVYPFVPSYEVDYPFIVIGEIFEKPYNNKTRTVVIEDVIIHVFNYHERIAETEDITYILTEKIFKNIDKTHYDWSINEDYKADSLFEYDDKKNEILSHVVIDMSFTNN